MSHLRTSFAPRSLSLMLLISEKELSLEVLVLRKQAVVGSRFFSASSYA